MPSLSIRTALFLSILSYALLNQSLPLVGQEAAPRGSQPSSDAVKQPLQLHSANPHYFLFRGQPTVLITAGEHYGAVLNSAFDYIRYLDVLKSHGFNLTRTFSGSYREVPGSFSITGNTLAPATGKYLCPWAPSDQPGASDGGNRFDLTQWDGRYFERLRDFVRAAGERGIVVEIVLFCTMYDAALWNASPMHMPNNVNGVGDLGPFEVYSGKDAALAAVQQQLVRKIVTELNAFENVYYEICNEPYERGGLSSKWNDLMIQTIVETETVLPFRHLIAQGMAHGALNSADLDPRISVLNFHAARPDAATLNYDLSRSIAFDETGGSDQSDRKYRSEGWEFMLAGGAVYSHLDFSFTVERPDGSAVPLTSGTPGGGGPELRKQLAILKKFIAGFDLVRMAPRQEALSSYRITPTRTDAEDHKLPVRILAEPGKAYAIYVVGGSQVELNLNLPGGTYRAEWINPKTGSTEGMEHFAHAGGEKRLASPAYQEDVALRVALSSP